MQNSMKNISPYQDSKNARKELRELLQSIGFTVHHCSLREVIYSDEKPMMLQFLSTLFFFKYAKSNFMLSY